MTELLEKAFAEAAKLPDAEQERFAQWILDELDERRWDEAFAKSADVLASLAGAALAEFKAGRTEELDPDNL